MSINEKILFDGIQDTTLFSTTRIENTPIEYFNQGYVLDEITQLTRKTQNEVLYSIADYYFSQGLNVLEIAEKLNQNTSIIQRLLRNKIKEQIIILLKEKNKTSQISKKLGIENQTTRRWIKEIAKAPSEKLYDKDFLAKAVLLLQEGKSIAETAHMLNITKEFLKEMLRNRILLDYIQLKGIGQIANTYHMDITTISKLVREANITVYEKGTMNLIYTHFNNGNYMFLREISPFLQEIVDGELLGDGYLSKQFK